MSEQWGDRLVSEDAGLVVERLDLIEKQLRRLADGLEEYLAAMRTPMLVIKSDEQMEASALERAAAKWRELTS